MWERFPPRMRKMIVTALEHAGRGGFDTEITRFHSQPRPRSIENLASPGHAAAAKRFSHAAAVAPTSAALPDARVEHFRPQKSGPSAIRDQSLSAVSQASRDAA